MNGIDNDQVRLFDNGKKLTFSDCPDSSLDEIGSDLLSHDFLKDDNGISRGGRDLGGGSNFSDPLLIINNELGSQRQITLDDVVDLDLSSLTTLENNGIEVQHPQESLGFNDLLSGSSFCLNGLSEKLSDSDKPLNFGSFGGISVDPSLSKAGGKAFKIVPTYVDGKLTNTLHLSPLHSSDHLDDVNIPEKIFQQIATSTGDLPVSTGCSAPNPSEKITATIEDFPSISMVPGNALNLNGPVHPNLPTCEIEPEISDLIKVKPREPKKVKKKSSKNSLSSIKKKKEKREVRKKKAASSALSASTVDSTVGEFQPKNGIPRFKIIQPDLTPSSDASISTTSNNFNNGLMFLPVTEPAAPSAPVVPTSQPSAATTIPTKVTEQQPIELILPVITVRDEKSSKTVLKSISDLQPGDLSLGKQGLSHMQKQQIAVILKQREAHKRATGSSSNGSKRNDNKIICRVLYPEDFVEPKVNGSQIGEALNEESAKSNEDGNRSSEPPKPKKPKIVKPKDSHLSEEFEADIALAPSVTRSGRTSRPPKKLVKRVSKLTNSITAANDDGKPPTNTNAPTTEVTDHKPKPELLDGLPLKKKPSKKPAHVCPTCGKRYIEAKIFLKHLEKFPSHAEKELTTKILNEILNPPQAAAPASTTAVRAKRKCKCKCKNNENCRARKLTFKQLVESVGEKEFVKTCGARFVKNTSVWDFLLLRIKTLHKYEDYVKGLLSELGKLWETLKTMTSKILYPCDEPSETSVTIEDETSCGILGIPKGLYQTFPSGLDTPTNHPEVFQGDTEPTASEQGPLILLPDTKEDISQSSLLSDILCDKSGMDTVDQLVNERLKTLAPGDDILIDPPSDDLMNSLLNSVHTNSLSDSMFNPLVSGSNDDLLKALENLSNPIDNPHTLDFTALTNDYPDR